MAEQLTNYKILQSYYEQSSYKDVLPELTRNNIADVGNAILSRPEVANDMISVLINELGAVQVYNAQATNKFLQYKMPQLVDGDYLKEIYVEFDDATDFDDSTDTNPLATKDMSPLVSVIYYTTDAKMYVKATISEMRLRKAFNREGGLSELVSALNGTMENTATHTDYIRAKHMVSDEKSCGVVIDVNLGNDDQSPKTDAEISKTLLALCRNTASEMEDLSTGTKYSVLKKKNATSSANLLVCIDKLISNTIDLEQLAKVFILDKANMPPSLMPIDRFDSNDNYYYLKIPVITFLDKRGLKIADTLRTTDYIRNPRVIATNYFYHFQGFCAYSLHMPHALINLVVNIKPDELAGAWTGSGGAIFTADNLGDDEKLYYNDTGRQVSAYSTIYTIDQDFKIVEPRVIDPAWTEFTNGSLIPDTSGKTVTVVKVKDGVNRVLSSVTKTFS